MSERHDGSPALWIFPPGSKVMLGGVEALVTGVTIRDRGHVVYEVNWWDGSTHTCKWLDALEVQGCGEKTAIGFLACCKVLEKVPVSEGIAWKPSGPWPIEST